MGILFLGEEGAYESAAESGIREGGSPIFFSPALPELGCPYPVAFDAIVIPAQRFLALAPLNLPVPVFASGPPSLLAECLIAGCADYLREPWSIDELEARLSKHAGGPGSLLEEGGRWDGTTLTGPGGQQILSPGLSSLLSLLLANRGACVPRQALYAVLGSADIHSRSLDMQISRLRRIFIKLELALAALALQSAPGGYRFTEPGT